MNDLISARALSIKSWAEDDRPREKLLLKGRNALSNAELLAILINKGTVEDTAVDLAKKILASSANSLNELGKLSTGELCKIRGIGEVKAVTIIAALELGRRRKEESATERAQIRTSRDIFELFHPLMGDLSHEEFWVLLLNRAHKVIGSRRISEGGISDTVADARIIFKHAIEAFATSIALCHNHPSGNILPSPSDKQLTRKLKDAGTLLDIVVTDHIIIGDRQYYSFADNGLL